LRFAEVANSVSLTRALSGADFRILDRMAAEASVRSLARRDRLWLPVTFCVR